MIVRTLLILICTALPVSAAEPLAEIRQLVDGFVMPRTEAFAESGTRLADTVDGLCRNGGDGSLEAARAAFKDTALHFAAIDLIRIGPTETDNRRDRLLFWPDRRSRGLRQVQRALAQKDETVLSPDTLAAKSVALQGFGALEFLLFGTGSSRLAEAGDAFRCGYAASSARNIAHIAAALLADWRKADGFAALWSQPGADNPDFRTRDEALGALIGRIAAGLEILADQRLRPIAPDEAGTRSPKRALFWRSGLTRATLRANLLGIRETLDASGLLDLAGARTNGIASNLAAEFEFGLAAFERLPDDPERMIAMPQNAKRLSFLIIVVKSIQNLVGTELAYALGLPSSFSPLDGD